jgi:hypothetical protein
VKGTDVRDPRGYVLPMAALLFGCQHLFCHHLFNVRLGSAAVEIASFKKFVTFAIAYDEITRFDKVKGFFLAGCLQCDPPAPSRVRLCASNLG